MTETYGYVAKLGYQFSQLFVLFLCADEKLLSTTTCEDILQH